jgi:hypothetical protein
LEYFPVKLQYLKALVVVAGACALVPSAVGAPAANSATFQDSTSERQGAPDITTVVVSNNNAGIITFRINITGRSGLTDDMLVLVFVDADNNAATGETGAGTDYAVQLFQGAADLYRWDGSGYSRRAADPPQSSLIFNGLTFRISAADLAGTKRFNFATEVVTGLIVDPNTGDFDDSKALQDFAPDQGHGLWNYQVRVGALRLGVKSFALSPSRPRAGSTFTASMVATRTDTGATLVGGQVSCTAIVGGKRLTARVQRFSGSKARCAWQIPASARGQKIRGTVTVVFEGRRVSRSFSATVG